MSDRATYARRVRRSIFAIVLTVAAAGGSLGAPTLAASAPTSAHHAFAPSPLEWTPCQRGYAECATLTVPLDEQWRRGEDDSEEVFFALIDDIAVADDGTLYIVLQDT